MPPPDQILWAHRSASDCADRPMSGRDFASPATSSVNHSRDDLAATVSWIPVKGKQSDSISRYGEKDISSRALVAQAAAALLRGVALMFVLEEEDEWRGRV